MKNDKINTLWHQKQLIKLYALKNVTDNLTPIITVKNQIEYQFLNPQNKFHKLYNVYKRQFEFLLNKKSLKFLNQKKTFLKEKENFYIKPDKLIKVETSNVIYNPVQNIKELNLTIKKIDDTDNVCIFCDKNTIDLEKHYRNEIVKINEKNKTKIVVFVDILGCFYGKKLEFLVFVLEKVIDLKRMIFEKTEIGIEIQIIKIGNDPISDDDYIPEVELTLTKIQ